MSDELLTGQEVAELFRVHLSTVLRWAKSGDLAAVKVGGVVRFRRSEIDRVLNGNTPQPEPVAS